MTEHHDIVVIGGGQAGLAMSAVLQRCGREHVVLERRRVGERWRTERWESLRFQFPNWTLELPGYAYSGDDPDGFADSREIVQVIENYAASTQSAGARARRGGHRAARGRRRTSCCPCRAGRSVRVRSSSRPGRFSGRASRSSPRALRLRCCRPIRRATGARRTCRTEPCSWSGSGASGCQIGDELLRAGRTVFISVSRHRRVPRRFRGKDVTWWLDRMGRFDQTIDSFPGRAVALVGRRHRRERRLRRQRAPDGRRWHPGAREGRRRVRRNVGHRGATRTRFSTRPTRRSPGFSRPLASSPPGIRTWTSARRSPHGVSGPARHDCRGRVPRSPARERRGDRLGDRLRHMTTAGCRSPLWMPRAGRFSSAGSARCRGLYFLGLHWMHTFKSGLLSGVGSDAEYLAEHMAGTH